jgi:hypothetical protein
MQVYKFSPYDFSFEAAATVKLDIATTQALGVLSYEPLRYSTDKAPPQTYDKQVAIFNNGDWIVKPDHRGEIWFLGNNALAIAAIGNPADLGFTKEPPAAQTGSAAPVVYPYDEAGVYLGKPVNQLLDVAATQAKNEVIWQDVPNSTDVAPPELKDKQAAVWNKDKWQIVPDHRGEVWFDEAGTQVKITKVGLVETDLFDAENHALIVELRAEEERKQAEVKRLAVEAQDKQNATITAYQARMGLSDEQLVQFETSLALPENKRVKIAWEYDTDYKRTSLPIAAMQALFKWSDEQAEAFFDVALRG